MLSQCAWQSSCSSVLRWGGLLAVTLVDLLWADRSGSVAGVPGGQAAVLEMQIHPK